MKQFAHFFIIMFIILLVAHLFKIQLSKDAIDFVLETGWALSGLAFSLSYIYIDMLIKSNQINAINKRISESITTSKESTSLDEKDKEKISNSVKEAMTSNLQKKPLDDLIGLESVKAELKNLSHFIATQKKRELAGLPTQSIGLHLVFAGNPGTGKTIVAREVAKIYKAYGLLEKGHLVETDKAGLVAEYLGQTPKKTKEIINKAKGGILFIDEAYTLCEEHHGYGQEAIDTLLKEMEDNRKNLAVIIAGYPDQMKKFINSNPGLSSRFTRTIEFPDYNTQELLEIFELMLKKNQYTIADKARTQLATWLITHAPIGQPGFGNGRFMRNLFEQCVVNQSARVSQEQLDDIVALQLITAEDIQSTISKSVTN